MKLYLSHSSAYDYETDLYQPLKESSLANEHDIFFPHDLNNTGVNTKDILPTYDAVIAEVSLPSTGQGMELARADASSIPIICFYRAGSRPTTALRFVTDTIVGYTNSDDMINKLRNSISSLPGRSHRTA